MTTRSLTRSLVLLTVGGAHFLGFSSFAHAQGSGGGAMVTVSPKVALDAAITPAATAKQSLPQVAPVKAKPTAPVTTVKVNPAATKAVPRSIDVKVAPSASAVVKPPVAITKPSPNTPSLDPGAIGNAARTGLDGANERVNANLHRDLRGLLEVAPDRMAVPGAAELGRDRGKLTDIQGGIGSDNDPLSKMPGGDRSPNDALVNVMPDSTTPRSPLGNAGPSERRGQGGGHFLVSTPREAMGGAASTDPKDVVVTEKHTTETRGANGTTIYTTHITRANGAQELWQENRGSDGELNYRRHVTTDPEGNVTSDRWRGSHRRDRGRGPLDPNSDTAGNPDPYGDASDSPLARAFRERVNVGPKPDLEFRNPNDDTTDPDERAGPGGPPTGPRVIVSREQLVGDPSLAEARRQVAGNLEPPTPEELDPGPGGRPPGDQ